MTLSHHLVDFSRQVAENKFQLKSTILCDIAKKIGKKHKKN